MNWINLFNRWSSSSSLICYWSKYWWLLLFNTLIIYNVILQYWWVLLLFMMLLIRVLVRAFIYTFIIYIDQSVDECFCLHFYYLYFTTCVTLWWCHVYDKHMKLKNIYTCLFIHAFTKKISPFTVHKTGPGQVQSQVKTTTESGLEPDR